MASAIDGERSLARLRGKFSGLARKYAQLLERLERRAMQDLAMFRLGAFGLHVTGAALALIGNGRIRMSNPRFAQLARSIRGDLTAIVPPGGPPYPDLRTLALAQAERMLQKRKRAIELRYRDTRSEAVIALRLERNADSVQPVVMAVAEDVSEQARREHELVRTREALLHRERLHVLGELAASIAHDLGNTLRGASFQLAALRDPALPDDRREDTVKAVSRRVEVASETVARLHDFAQTGTLGVSAVRLDRVVAQAAALVEIDFHAVATPVNIRLSIPELPPVRGSVAELSLLFVNLLRNARDAMPAGGTVTVAARKRGASAVVTVADQGTGISREVQQRLFEPFFTTKGPRGTGLGLWLAKGTMERLGGTIRAASRPRGGALFALTFPLHDLGQGRRSSTERRVGAPRAPPAPAPRRRPRAPGSRART